jgi:hypothetical protein
MLPPDLGAEVARLADVADALAEGEPYVGVIERRGEELWLVGPQGTFRLAGPLAHPRIAGPGYRVWVIGDLGSDLHARRIGVLRPATSSR